MAVASGRAAPSGSTPILSVTALYPYTLSLKASWTVTIGNWEEHVAKTYVKRIGLLRKKASLSQEQFVSHWLNVHAELCTKLPGMRRYSINFIDRQKSPKLNYDGFSELWFDTEADLNAGLNSPEGRTLLADLPNFVEEIEPALVVEHVMLGQ